MVAKLREILAVCKQAAQKFEGERFNLRKLKELEVEITNRFAAVHQLFIDFKKAYDSVRKEVLYNILIEFGVPK